MTHNDSQVEAVMALVEEHGALKWGEGMSAGSHDKLSVRRFGAEAKEGLSEIRTALSALAAGKVEAIQARLTELLERLREKCAEAAEQFQGSPERTAELIRAIELDVAVRQFFAASPSPLSADPESAVVGAAKVDENETRDRLRFLRRVCNAELAGLSRTESLRMIEWLEHDFGVAIPEGGQDAGSR